MLILNGRNYDTPFRSKSYAEDPSLRLVSHQRDNRSGWVRAIVLHTTQGRYPQPILPGFGRGGGAVANIRYWNGQQPYASAHLLVDTDGTVYQGADLIAEETWHANSVNPVTVGIEIVQGVDGSLYDGQLDVAAQLVDWLTDALDIPKQIPDSYTGPIRRISAGGQDVVGVYGHRDQTSNKGRGDPGDEIMARLAAKGYERFDIAAGDDLAAWRARQMQLGVTPVDGVPGPSTMAALRATQSFSWGAVALIGLGLGALWMSRRK